MNRKIVHSVGIDIGTTTTQVIFSRLTLVNRAPVTQVARYEFVDREICFQSPVYRTPLIESEVTDIQSIAPELISSESTDNNLVDVKRLQVLINDQFTAAGFRLEDIETGAIIITGETSKANNAREAVMALADSLGDFVVATAGPNLESVIAGRGSGAGDYSKRHRARVLNIDIGGGTSNYAVFENGNVVDTACLNVGGHLIETDANGAVRLIHAPARKIVDAMFGNTTTLNQLTIEQLEKVTDCMADLIVECINAASFNTEHLNASSGELRNKLLMTPSLQASQSFDAIFLSGGVGDVYYQLKERDLNPFEWKDVGVLLARSLLQHSQLSSLPVKRPAQTLQATVIGAGAYSLSLSGSSIWLNTDELPIRNLPVAQPIIDWLQTEPDVCGQIVIALQRMDLQLHQDRYAVAFDAAMPVLYQVVNHTAKQLAHFYQQHGNSQAPAVIVTQNDLGKVLGMELQPLIDPQQLLVIDEVCTREGDYIDVGQGFFGGDVVPLTIKSLAFPA